MLMAEVNKVGFPAVIKNKTLLLNGDSYDDLKLAARLIDEGEAIISPICGVMGFVCDATRLSGAEQIYDLKGRDRSQQLITVGSLLTRQRLINKDKLASSWHNFDFSKVYDFPTFVIFPSVEGLSKDFVRPDSEDLQTDTVAIWWANHYRITRRLESFLQELNPDSFIGGSSCNRSRQESITNSWQAFAEFGRGSQRVAAIIYDQAFDRGEGLIKGSHGMLKISGDKIRPYRAGSVHMDSYKPILRERFCIPEGFENSQHAVALDAERIRRAGHYLNKPETFTQRLVRLFKLVG